MQQPLLASAPACCHCITCDCAVRCHQLSLGSAGALLAWHLALQMPSAQLPSAKCFLVCVCHLVLHPWQKVQALLLLGLCCNTRETAPKVTPSL